MDFKPGKSPVSRIDLGSGLDFNKLKNANETKMWTIPSLTERHLHDLLKKFPDSVKDVIEKDIIPFVSAESARFDLKNASIFMLGPNNQKWKIISGHGKYQINVQLTDINDPVITIKAIENKPEEIHCKEITKTFLGKCIIQKCGNEGTTKKESMRQLLQIAINRLYTGEYDTNILKTAKIHIYDSMETLVLVSGDGRNEFVVNSGNGNPTFKCVKLEKKKTLSKFKIFGYLLLIGFVLLVLGFRHVRAGLLLWKICLYLINRLLFN